ncbi:EARP and GARP complex-interacting protein 1 isoform X1 [Felis catus]|uniref:EARP and GARP complex-interacting protein 1 n=2 Tax=Felinae TaxID=338152 RepID=A0ABI7VTE1_FELCA|nr:EARP and GARP complex-interacting protein 1 isoform X1 [Felis catus]
MPMRPRGTRLPAGRLLLVNNENGGCHCGEGLFREDWRFFPDTGARWRREPCALASVTSSVRTRPALHEAAPGQCAAPRGMHPCGPRGALMGEGGAAHLAGAGWSVLAGGPLSPQERERWRGWPLPAIIQSQCHAETPECAPRRADPGAREASDSKVLTCAAVWRMPKELEPGSHESPDDSSSPAHTLELLCHLDDTAHGSVACVVWEPTGDGRRVISLADSHILLWDLQESSSQAVLAGSASLEGKGQLKFTSGRWSPHHTCTQVATANDTTIRGWDTRSMSQIYCIENAHGQLVRDLDFNPNKQYYLASCGDDCKVKFWDTRNVTEPVKTLEEHSHWVWSVRYNHSHDQLVLTGSSDSRVILSNMVSISSEPFGHLVDDDDLSDQEERRPEEKSQEPPQDSVIATYEEHEDSVYAVDWSSADPWLFASLSYDGRLVINRVPRALKYHILL